MNSINDMPTNHPPEFDVAVQQLRDVLTSLRWPSNIAWLQRDGLAGSRHLLFVHRRRLVGTDQVAAHYRSETVRISTVLLSGLGYDADYSYCYLWAPRDQQEAHESLMPEAGLKLALRDPPLPVRRVGPAAFAWHRYWSRKEDLSDLLGA